MVKLEKMAAGGLVLALLGAAGEAAAFCRTSSCELGEEEDAPTCQRDEDECVTEGNPLHWESPCIPYVVQEDGSPKSGIDAVALQEAAAAAFAAWRDVQCPGGGSPRFEAQFQGFVSCDRREAVCGGAEKNINVIMFHDQGWSEDPSAIGLTTPAGGTSSGLLVDADLELNSQWYDFAGGATGGAARLADVLAHEIGHFLGLGHSKAPGALMSESYGDVAMSRELLTADDVAAICAVFPPGAQLSCKEPPPPAYDACQLEPGERPPCTLVSKKHHRSTGCSVLAAPPPGTGLELLLLVGVTVLLRRRARVVSACSGTPH